MYRDALFYHDALFNRIRCYIASLQGTELPNPHVSYTNRKKRKHTHNLIHSITICSLCWGLSPSQPKLILEGSVSSQWPLCMQWWVQGLEQWHWVTFVLLMHAGECPLHYAFVCQHNLAPPTKAFKAEGQGTATQCNLYSAALMCCVRISLPVCKLTKKPSRSQEEERVY